MQSLSKSTRVGVWISVLGVVLLFTSDVLISGLPASWPDSLWLAIPPALFILGISAFACFRKLPRWLLALNCVISILGCLLQVLLLFANTALSCFDECQPEQVVIVRDCWILIGLVGFLLSTIGAFFLLNDWQPEKARD